MKVDPKYVSLFFLILQNSGLAIAMRFTLFGKSKEDAYITSTAVLVAELLKLAIATTLCFVVDSEYSWKRFTGTLHKEFVIDRADFMKLTVPSVLYTVQNSLQYYSMSCLSAPVFQVLYQAKIITTAIFSVIILSRKLSSLQWSSIIGLAGGVALVQLSQLNEGMSEESKSNSFLGLISVLCGCMTSGFAGVYFELVLKSSSASIWLRNIQLSVIGICIALLSCYLRDYEAISTRGFLAGYDNYVWLVIVLQAAGGLIVAVVVKYADNVLKGFATSLSILLSCFASSYLFDDILMNLGFTIGCAIVVGAVFAFGYQPQASTVPYSKV